MVDDDSLAILDLQIAKTIDDADNCLFETSIIHRDQSKIKYLSNSFTRSDSGVGTDTSEK